MTDACANAELSVARAFASTLQNLPRKALTIIFACLASATHRPDRNQRERPHQFVLTIARVILPMSRMRAGIGKRVLAIITASA